MNTNWRVLPEQVPSSSRFVEFLSLSYCQDVQLCGTGSPNVTNFPLQWQQTCYCTKTKPCYSSSCLIPLVHHLNAWQRGTPRAFIGASFETEMANEFSPSGRFCLDRFIYLRTRIGQDGMPIHANNSSNEIFCICPIYANQIFSQTEMRYGILTNLKRNWFSPERLQLLAFRHGGENCREIAPTTVCSFKTVVCSLPCSHDFRGFFCCTV